jgi:multidrug efflux system membrane fusion protein
LNPPRISRIKVPPPAHRRPRRFLITGVLAIAATLASYVVVQAYVGRNSGAAVPPPPPPAVPVQIATAERRDVSVYLPGLGTVQAYNTVVVRTQVDGQLQLVTFTEGQNVKAGDLLAQIDPRPFQANYDQAVARKMEDQANLVNANINLRRFTNLAPGSYVTLQTLDTQRATVAQLEAQIRADQGAIDFARTQLDYTRITSPLAGRTGIRLVDQGNIVHAADTTGLVAVTQLQPISVIFTLPEDQLAAVKSAMAAGPVPILAMSRSGKQQLAQGTLGLIDNEIQQGTGTIRLKGTFPNVDEALWPGEFVNIRLLAQTAHGALTVPSDALQRGPQGFFAYVVKPDSTVEVRPIDAGAITGGRAVVLEGLKAGEQVVTAGQYRLAPGVKIEAAVTAASR